MTEQEILKCIKSLKRENAMGPDYMHNVFIIEGKEILVPALKKLYNLCLKHRKIGFLWRA